MIIKVLGSGCRNCITLTENTKAALQKSGMDAEILKIEDIQEIMQYGVMSTPALVVDEKVVSVGRVLKPMEIQALLEKVKQG